jgi:hypothetical protein
MLEATVSFNTTVCQFAQIKLASKSENSNINFVSKCLADFRNFASIASSEINCLKRICASFDF